MLKTSCLSQFNLQVVYMFYTRMLRKSRYFAGNACVSCSISKRFEEKKKVICGGFLDNLMQVIIFLAHYLHYKQVQELKKSTDCVVVGAVKNLCCFSCFVMLRNRRSSALSSQEKPI